MQKLEEDCRQNSTCTTGVYHYLPQTEKDITNKQEIEREGEITQNTYLKISQHHNSYDAVDTGDMTIPPLCFSKETVEQKVSCIISIIWNESYTK